MEWLSGIWEWLEGAFKSEWLTNVLLLGVIFELASRLNAIEARLGMIDSMLHKRWYK